MTLRNTAILLLLLAGITGSGSARAQPYCPGIAPWVFADVQASSTFCPSITWMAQNSVTLGCGVIDPANRLYCPGDFVTREQMAAFMKRQADAVMPPNCAPGQVMKWNGAGWACANDNIGGSGGGGTVTSVLAGTGLQASPNPIVGAGSINLAPSYQLPQSCANGQVPKNNGTGGWTCAADATGSGTVTSITAGVGLTGGTITAAGTLAVDTNAVQSRVTGTCAAGSSIRTIAANGTVTCEVDDAGPANAFVQGGNAFGTVAALGTTSNHALEVRVNSARVMRYEPNATSPNVIGGSPANIVGANVIGATILGGGVVEIPGEPGVAGHNRVLDTFGTVGGGAGNWAGSDNANATDASYATVGGGRTNEARARHSVVGGGSSNIALNESATVAGGAANWAFGGWSSVGGGNTNRASAPYSTVPGGEWNCAGGDYSFAGGRRAKVARSPVGFVGGCPSSADLFEYSGHAGAFVWADSNDYDFNSSVRNEFAVRATGGLRFVTAIDGLGSPVRSARFNPNGELEFGSNVRQMLNLWGSAFGIGVQDSTVYFRTGVATPAVDGGFSWFRGGVHNDVRNDPGTGGAELMRLATNGTLYVTGGTVAPLSDRASKHAFAAVDPPRVLEKVVALPLTEWSYNNDPQARHIGPTAQDFRAAFGLGDDDKSIATVDADGVALAAIQGLNAKLEAKLAERDSEIRALRAEIARLGAMQGDIVALKEAMSGLLRERAAADRSDLLRTPTTRPMAQ